MDQALRVRLLAQLICATELSNYVSVRFGVNFFESSIRG